MTLAAVRIALLAGLVARLGVYPDRLRGSVIAVATCIAAAIVLHFAAP